MKFKTTIVLFSILVALLVFVFVFETKWKKGKEAEEKLVELVSDEVEKIDFKKEDEAISFKKDENGNWLITSPLQAKADKYEVERLADDFSDLRIERVVEEEPGHLSRYKIPLKEITLWYKNRKEPVRILIGMQNPLDNTFFAKREDEKRVVLIPSYVKSLLEKKVFDFRQKDIFSFETDDVKNIKLRAKGIRWDAVKRNDEWWFSRPVRALARKSRIENITGSLSGLKAKDFVVEEKKPADMAEYGLDRADYVVTLGMPLLNKEITFFLQKKEEKLYATSSLSTKIVEVEDSILSDLEKKTEELREKEVVNFYSWEAFRVRLKKGEHTIEVEKDKEDNWYFLKEKKEEADKDKVMTLVRKIESLEASELIDPPFRLSDYGLEKPEIEVTIWTKEKDEPEEKAKEFKVLIGREDKENKKVVVKNERLNYLFRVDSDFLSQVPEKQEDWKAKKEEKKQENKVRKK
ncbi:MAG: DUF4340 domain-containing protein [Candidatus Aminicenantales bacterium]